MPAPLNESPHECREADLLGTAGTTTGTAGGITATCATASLTDAHNRSDATGTGIEAGTIDESTHGILLLKMRLIETTKRAMRCANPNQFLQVLALH